MKAFCHAWFIHLSCVVFLFWYLSEYPHCFAKVIGVYSPCEGRVKDNGYIMATSMIQEYKSEVNKLSQLINFECQK